MNAPLRIGVIGHTGRGNYGHGIDTAWRQIPETRIVAVADADPEGRRKAESRLGVSTSYADYRQMLESEKLDIVAVCPRWIDQHHAMILAAAEHGCHIYMEKPFCRTLREADEIIEQLEMRHLRLAIAHITRYSPVIHEVKKRIEQGEIGEILELRARGKEDRRGGGEDLWVLGTHMLDLMVMLGGPAQSCFARVTQTGVPVTRKQAVDGNEGIGLLAGDGIDASYRLASNATGFFASHRDKAGNPSRFGLTVYGSRGMIQCQSGYNRAAWILKDPSWSPGRSGVRWETISPSPSPVHADGNTAAIADLVNSIRQQRDPRSGPQEARRATEMIVAVFASHLRGSAVSLPLAERGNPWETSS